MLEWCRKFFFNRPDDEIDDPDFVYRLARASQEIRSKQSRRVLPMVIVTGITFTVVLWNDAPPIRLILWMSLVAISLIVRIIVCGRIAEHLSQADEEQLLRNEFLFFYTGIANTVVVGLGFWLVAYPGSERAVVAVTLLSCMYGIGTTVNSAVHFQSFPFFLAGNMAQGVLFHSGMGAAPELATLVAYVSIILVLLAFGKESARMFGESIRMRVENLYLVHQLAEEKQEVEKALSLAEDANESKNRFLAAASHDLRQPLHALSLFHGGLKLQLEGEKAFQLMARIDETTSVLRDQFNSLLDLSRFDAGGVEPEPNTFRVDQLLTRIAETNRPLADAKGLYLEVAAVRRSAYTDELLLERVIQNLVSNAIRYTEAGGVKILGRVVDDSPGLDGDDTFTGRIVVSVQDTGPGIDAADQIRIFEDFAQLKNPERRREQGVGLGLAIVRRIDQLLDLDLSLRSSVGEGSDFSVSFPYINGEPEHDAAVEEREPARVNLSFPGFRVWSVDDDARVREALSEQLRAWDCEVRTFASGAALRDQMNKVSMVPDLLILDDMIEGDASGLELAEWSVSRLDESRIVLVTGNTDPDRLAQLRASRYRLLQKPVSSTDLARTIDRLV